MALNLEKHKEAMVAAWSEVVDDKSPTNWALFGYEGQTNCLKLYSKGDGGLVEMAEDLNSGSIMYAFCQVQDPKTTLPKYVLINWQGEGAPVVRKGTCANHIRLVCDFLKCIHVTINARTEEDVDPKLVIDKVCKSTGSAYNFKERSNLSNSNNSGPVGTAYHRVNPGQEINSKERDRFWEREEQEERVRQEAERKRREEERRKQEEELRKRDMVEAAERDKRDSELNVKREIARSAEKVSRVEQTNMNGELDDREREERERRERSEVLRRQRSEEAQSLIAKRTINARAIFEQNTSAGQLSNIGRRASFQPSISNGITSPETVTPPQNFNRKSSLPSWPPSQMSVPSQPTEQPIAETPIVDETIQQTDETPVETSVPSSEDDRDWESEDSQTGTIVRKSHKKSTDVPNESVDTKLIAQSTPQTTTQTAVQPTVVPEIDPVFLNGGSAVIDDDEDDDDEDGDLGLKARALYDYQAADNTEITFYPGDIITHIEQIDEGWWQGFSPDGTFGLFPANYVELLD
ncbi:Drebrin-like protein [Frankliniella fusca]|uniref:Drebrin-like protein n=1 Tax=Frankliniella fusca TaxID=407009 RepID=A0AAE1LUD2_9NEOP|nr:Drebrin-like protein [Frankliniella fusca]